MNNFKTLLLWFLIFGVCIFAALRLIDRPSPVQLTVTNFLLLADKTFEERINAQPDADPSRITNDAFRNIVDRGGRVTGEVSTAALKQHFPEIHARLDARVTSENFVPFRTQYDAFSSSLMLERVMAAGILDYEMRERNTLFIQALPFILMLVIVVALWLFLVRQLQSSGSKAMSFGKSKAKMVAEGQIKVTFDDVAGADEAKEELKEIVEFLKDPKKFSRLGGKIPKGVLLFGPPGTGKTLLARAVAGEAGCPFFSISGSDFVEMFVGVGASRVRDLFETAKKNKPCVVFIDEIDAVGRHRFAGIGGGHDEREQTLNQLLVEMDGFAANEGVMLIAATNRSDVLDPALTRPGRFDRQVTVDYPDVVGREKILRVHAKNVKLGANVDLKQVAKGTPGFSGADLANIINEAALLATRRNKTHVELSDLEEAKDRVMMGPERRSLAITPEEKRKTAIHEAGHALAAYYTPGCDPVHKITIIPRGRSLGMTATLPGEERFNRTKSQLKAQLVYGLGGLAAEQVVIGEFSTGVGNDLMRITQLARRMICEVGMSDRLGPRTFGDNNSNIFLGRDLNNADKTYSEEMARIIDEEVKSLVDEAHEKAVAIMTTYRAQLDAVTQALVDRETLDGEEFKAILNGDPLPPLFKKDEDNPPSSPNSSEEKKPKAPRLGDILDGPRQVPG